MSKIKSFHGFFLFVLTLIFLSANFLTVKAQPTMLDADVISLLTMGQQDIILTGPLDSQEIIFRLPADWAIPSDSSVLHLNLNAATGMTSNTGVVGFFEVSLNQTWLTTVNLTADGEYSVDIPIPSNAWITTTRNASQRLTFTLLDALDCQMYLSALSAGGDVRGISAVLRASSYFDFTYTAVPISTDLQLFPYPIFQNTFIPDKAVLIIPNQPTQGEIQAAMNVSAAFGRLTDGKLNLQLITVSQLTDAISAESNLIFVGSPAAFPQLADAELPAPFNGTTFDNVRMSVDDGILQMAVSPQNPSKVWLFISGNNDAAIVKAAQAVGSDQIQPYGPSNLAIISEIGTNSQSTNKTDYTFADLGYPFEQTYTGSYNDLGIWFDMPANQQAADGAYFEMVFTNSAALNFDESDIKVNVNDNLIGGLRFSDRTTSITQWKFNIPTYLLHPGRNLLLLELHMSGSSPCIPPDELLFSIAPDSLLHLPTVAISSNTTRDLDLTSYPYSVFSTFDQAALVLPGSDSFAWSVASKLSFDLGRKLGGSSINLPTFYADEVPDNILRTKDLMLIGRPSDMPVIAQFSPVMPAPFEEGKDIAQEKNPQYLFAATNSLSVGYIQAFSSPWDSKLAVLTISGNMDEGLDAAATALLTSSVRKQLAGNFITVLNDKTIVQKVESESTSPTSPEIVLPNSQDSGKNEPTGKINIGLPLIVLMVVIIFAGIGIVVLLIMDRKDRRNEDTNNPNKRDGNENKGKEEKNDSNK